MTGPVAGPVPLRVLGSQAPRPRLLVVAAAVFLCALGRRGPPCGPFAPNRASGWRSRFRACLRLRRGLSRSCRRAGVLRQSESCAAARWCRAVAWRPSPAVCSVFPWSICRVRLRPLPGVSCDSGSSRGPVGPVPRARQSLLASWDPIRVARQSGALRVVGCLAARPALIRVCPGSPAARVALAVIRAACLSLGASVGRLCSAFLVA